MKQMSKWQAVAIAVFVASSIALPADSFADSAPTSTPAQDSFKASMDQYRADLEIYKAALKARGTQIRNINVAFKSACDKAASDFNIAISAAKGPDQKSAAVAARKGAITAAIVARDGAIAALGAEPTPPVEPAKPIKTPKGKGR